VNVHVDTFDPERVKRIMRFTSVEEIECGIAAAEEAGLGPIKINCVVTRDYNDQDVVDLARRGRQRGWHVRFIELMPLGGGETAHMALSQFVPSRETRQRLEAELGPLTPLPRSHPGDESRDFAFGDGVGRVGFISPVSEPYCGGCNRMRLTADGKFHLCLLNDHELDVKAALRGGGGIEDVKRILSLAVAQKPTGHRLDEGISTEERSMFQIGG
jgi:GTP 3',8-cyclase